MSRLLRKTKPVSSPGKKPNESFEEYQTRYIDWWMKNNKKDTSCNMGQLDINGSGLVTVERYAEELLPVLADWEAKSAKPEDPVSSLEDKAITGSTNCSTESGDIRTVLSGLGDRIMTPLVLDAGEVVHKKEYPKKLGVGCGTSININKVERQV